MHTSICILLAFAVTACSEPSEDIPSATDIQGDATVPSIDGSPMPDTEALDTNIDASKTPNDGSSTIVEVPWKKLNLSTRETLNDVWSAGDTTFWAVGTAGTLRYFNGATWLPAEQLTDSDLYGITGVPGGDIWAVGANGTILRRDTAGWNVLDAGIDVDLHDVHAVSNIEIYIVGNAGTILKFNGSEFITDTSNTNSNLRCVFGTPGGVLFAGGTGGQILKRSGGQWITTPAGSDVETIHDIWGTSTDFLVAVGTNGQILQLSNNNWTPQTSNDIKQRHLYSVWGVSDEEAYLVGDEGVMIAYDGDKWTLLETEGPLYRSSHFRAIGGTTVGEERIAFALGVEGAILSYDGGLWVDEESGPSVATLAITALSSSQFVAVGEIGLALRWSSRNQWSGIETGTGEDLQAVQAIGPQAIAVGTAGTAIIIDDHNETTSLDTGTTKTLEGIHGDSNFLLAVGAAGSALRLDGIILNSAQSGTPEMTGTVVTLRDVWVSADGVATAVGDSGTIVHRSSDGAWQLASAPTSNNLHGVTVDEDTTWIVGDHGLVLRSEGNGFVKDNEAPGRFLYDIATTNAGPIAVGWTGFVLRRVEGSWIEENSGTPNILEGLAASPDGMIWVVGHNGTVLHRK